MDAEDRDSLLALAYQMRAQDRLAAIENLEIAQARTPEERAKATDVMVDLAKLAAAGDERAMARLIMDITARE